MFPKSSTVSLRILWRCDQQVNAVSVGGGLRHCILMCSWQTQHHFSQHSEVPLLHPPIPPRNLKQTNTLHSPSFSSRPDALFCEAQKPSQVTLECQVSKGHCSQPKRWQPFSSFCTQFWAINHSPEVHFGASRHSTEHLLQLFIFCSAVVTRTSLRAWLPRDPDFLCWCTHWLASALRILL
jgi:hypothetical protein